MSNFPILRRKQVRFSNPLVGRFYDNSKYHHFYSEPDQQQSRTFKSQSVVCYPLKKEISMTNYFGLKGEAKSDALTKTSKVLKGSKGLGKQYGRKCSKEHAAIQHRIRSQPLEGFMMRKQAREKGHYFENKAIKFNDIEIKVIQGFAESRGLITEQSDEKKFKVNLEQYFQAFFKKKLPGVVSEELASLVEKYVDEVVEEEEKLDARHSSYKQFDVRDKRDLQQQLAQLHRCGETQKLKGLMRQYCVPSRQSREGFLRGLLGLVRETVNEQFHMEKEEYCLISERGQVIADFSQIKFSTGQLFVAQREQVDQVIQQHFSHVQQEQARNRKDSLRQTLKQHFRQQLTHGLYEENADPGPPFSEKKLERRENLARAQRIIDLKHSKQSERRRRLQELLQKQKSKARRSPTKNETKMNVPEERYVSLEQRIIIEFRRLKRINDYQVAAFRNDENNRNKVQYGIIAKESPYFRSKSQQQIERIYSALTFSEPKPSNYLAQVVTLAEYIQMRKIIACIAAQQSTIAFVDRYLCYDQYGQLQRQELKERLAFMVGGKKTGEVICLTLWKWLEKNGAIINDMLVRSNMRMLYRRNKIVFYLLVSLIFGTNEATLQDLAE